MLKTLKIKEQENEVAFIGCTHFSHNRDFIYGPRGFSSSKEHDETLIQRWNETCSNRSVVFHLGDFCFNDPTSATFRGLIRRLNFKTMYCLWGNHNSSSKACYQEELKIQFPSVFNPNGYDFCEVYPLIHNVDGNQFKQVVFLPEYVEAVINGDRFILCHFPIYSHHKQSHGSYHLASHCHGNCALTNKNTGKGRRLEVGVESFGRPVTLKEVISHLNGRELNIVDHHGEDS